MDFSKLKLEFGQKTRETDPLKVFGGLTQRGKIQTLYGPQQEALTRWHKELRGKADILFTMATGGGKTLVGLLAAQSLVNETNGKVVYVCATNQLVEQTAEQAKDCGIHVATYAAGQWTNKNSYDSAESCCVTNYHAIFNGRTRFRDDQIRAVLLDDAHVAPAIIRDCFTLKISREHPAWGPLMGIFHGHFSKSAYASRFDSYRSADARKEGILFVPAWFIWSNRFLISEVFTGNSVETHNDTKFSYDHLRSNLADCAFLLSHQQIEITPTVLPTHTLPYFSDSVRRIYLTATLPSRYECIRAFGVSRADVVSPRGKMGAAQRLFIFPDSTSDENAYEQTRSLISKHKACIVTCAKYRAAMWQDLGDVYSSSDGHSAIAAFAKAKDQRKLILAGIFDGIDLPGDSCKVLVLDGLPRGKCLHDRYLEEYLNATRLRTSQIAMRLTQAIGRIFRSNTDHGIVILADKAIQSWLRAPDHQANLPELLQRQIRLGTALHDAIDRTDSQYLDVMDRVIKGAPDWDSFYNAQLAKVAGERKEKEPDWGDESALKEYDAWRHAWEGRHEKAAKALSSLADSMIDKDRALV